MYLNNLKTGSQKLHDFSISATGLKCNFLTSFSLVFVSKQVHQEALSVIFRNATVQLYVEIPKYGLNPKVAASVPNIIEHLKMHPLLQEFARKLTVVIQAEPASALLRETEGYYGVCRLGWFGNYARFGSFGRFRRYDQ
jgi:hypothetical protein